MQKELGLLAPVHTSKRAEWWGLSLFHGGPFPFPFEPWLATSEMCLYLNPRVCKYFPILRCSVGMYFFVKLVTFWASNFIRSIKTYLPSLITMDVWKGLKYFGPNFMNVHYEASKNYIDFESTLALFSKVIIVSE